MQQGDLDKNILLHPVEGKWHQRRPPMSWFVDIKRWVGMTMAEAVMATSDDKRWRGVVTTASQNVLNK